ncbi:MAG TPA: hypothetical protein VGJ26_18125 [Pirellulales bacterium]|jgi:hypothetical protein
MPLSSKIVPRWLICLVALLALGAEQPSRDWKETHSFAAPEATQAAAADDRFVYAISNRVIAKYDRATEKLIARSTGEASHLNSGFFFAGKLYSAHSNFPEKPERSELKVLDPEKMSLETYKNFGASDGSLTWAIRDPAEAKKAESATDRPDFQPPSTDFDKGIWWLNFAYYGDENSKTYLARYENGRETRRWTYPPEAIKKFGKNSASCGIWRDDRLLVTGHDEREFHLFELPKEGSVLTLVATVAAPFTGQGFAADPAGGGLIGIDRAKRRVVIAR